MRMLALALLLVPVAIHAQAKPADVIIYRCTDHGGQLTLRDTPCRKDQVQQTLTMVRPHDAPPVPLAPVAPQAPVLRRPAAPEVSYHEPRPLYECVPPDGEPYTSDTPQGHPRWVPLWTLGIYDGLSLDMRSGVHQPLLPDGSGAGVHPPVAHERFGPGAYGPGTWIRDECYALPQAEVCARLVDRRDEIRRRFFNAMPSERETLNVEERSINARLDDDCGDY